MPALSLAAIPKRRRAILDLAPEVERRGWNGIWCPSLGDNMSLALALAMATERIEIATSIAPIYLRHPSDWAQAAAFLHEISEGRFRFGVGVSHGPVHDRLQITPGKPLSDMRRFVGALREVPRIGELPPVILATLRDKMLGLSAEIAEGAVFANGALSHMPHSLAVLDDKGRGSDFVVANMLPTVISNDSQAAAARNRRTLAGYVALPNYRNYWRAAGFEEEMDQAEKALAAGDQDALQAAMSDRWLRNVTLYGSVEQVRDGVAAWYEAGVTPILVPSSASGNQLQAIQEVFDAFA